MDMKNLGLQFNNRPIVVPDNNNTDKEYPYSMGTGPIINSLLDILQGKLNKYDTVLINFGTLIRNNYVKGMSLEQLVADTKKEVEDVVTVIVDHINKSFRVKNPYIIGYVATYEEYLPQKTLRNTDSSRMIYAAAKAFANEMNVSGQYQMDKMGGVHVIQAVISGKRGPIHIGLLDIIRRLPNNKRCLVISSFPLDYHIRSDVPAFTILNSFTGETIEGKKIGEKVFKNSKVPFNVYTHALLGDSKVFKGSVHRTEKKRLINLAQRELWHFRTVETIKRSLQNNGFAIPFDLTKRGKI